MMNEDRLREIYGTPSPLVQAKAIAALDRHCREFIANSTFLLLATTDGESLDVSPKGDPAGFVHVEDETHLLLPDRPGNNRIDGLLNIVRNPKVALLFLIPTVDEALRVNGSAAIHDDPALCATCAINGRAPKTVTRITVEEVFAHCGKAPLRGGLWKPQTWPEARPVGTLGEIVKDHTKMDNPYMEQDAIDAHYAKTLY